MKRIQINKKFGKGRVRVSRTSAPNVSFAPRRGFTLNSSHGIRLSKSFKGVQLAFQNTNFILRGRRSSKGGTNVNLSKSGVSLSQRTKFGTFNLINPNRSSANLLGMNIRGKKAANALAALVVLEGVFKMLLFAFRSIPTVIRLAIYAANVLLEIVKFTFSVILYIFLGLPKELLSKNPKSWKRS
jgi:hypothetical protein